jgi:predicted NAD/FAD-dependent oxidoreductase
MASIAIIGAGIAGLTLARELSGAHRITVFEKSRGFGGRVATRRSDRFQFDHGAQFITAQTDAFRAFTDQLRDAGVIANWPASFVELRRDEVTARRQWGNDCPHYVGVPGMSAIGKHLAADLHVELETHVHTLARDGKGWRLCGEAQEPLGTFDWVVCTAPAAQTANLLAPASLASQAGRAHMQACCALLLGFDEPPGFDWQAALVRDADISWVSVNSSKPGRPAAPALVVHSTNAWANEHLDAEAGAVQRHLAAELLEVTGIDAMAATFADLHRWRYANVDRRDGEPFALDANQRLAACGDWFVRGRVEGAFTSAMALADRLARECR